MAGARRCAMVVPKSTVSPSMIPYRRAGGPPEVIAVHTAGPRPHAGGPWGCRPGVPLAPAGFSNRGVRMTPALLRQIGNDFKV